MALEQLLRRAAETKGSAQLSPTALVRRGDADEQRLTFLDS
jgi:hypothetical protein